MNHHDRNETKATRYYIPKQYRRMTLALMGSFALSFLLVLMSTFFYLRWPAQRYFASNAEYAGSILEIMPQSGPNDSDQPLLPPDMPPEISAKDIETPTATSEDQGTPTSTTPGSEQSGDANQGDSADQNATGAPSAAADQSVPGATIPTPTPVPVNPVGP